MAGLLEASYIWSLAEYTSIVHISGYTLDVSIIQVVLADMPTITHVLSAKIVTDCLLKAKSQRNLLSPFLKSSVPVKTTNDIDCAAVWGRQVVSDENKPRHGDAVTPPGLHSLALVQ